MKNSLGRACLISVCYDSINVNSLSERLGRTPPCFERCIAIRAVIDHGHSKSTGVNFCIRLLVLPSSVATFLTLGWEFSPPLAIQ